MGSKVGADVGSDVGCLEGIVVGGAEGVGTLGRLTSPLCGGQMRESSSRLGEVAQEVWAGTGAAEQELGRPRESVGQGLQLRLRPWGWAEIGRLGGSMARMAQTGDR